PRVTRPDWPADQHHPKKHYSHLSAGNGEGIRLRRALRQVPDGSEEVDAEEEGSRSGRGHVVIEDSLRVAHGGFRRSNDQSLVRSPGQKSQGDQQKKIEDWRFHSAFSTVSNSNRETVVYTTPYTARNFIWLAGESSPVSTLVVAVTMAVTAGMEIGSKS